MIQPLRTIHRRAFVALAFALPAVLVAGLGARHSLPHASMQAVQLPASARLVKGSGSLWRQHAIRSEFYAAPDQPQQIYVVLQPEHDLNEPDLLVYWTIDAPQENSLPARAQLLGAFAPGKAFALPGGVLQGTLVLFSLAHQMVFDTSAVEKLP